MSYQVEVSPLFEDRQIGPAAKRLAFLFNVSANMSNNGNPLENVEKLFIGTTGLKEVPSFSWAEVDYLKLKLLETAAVFGKGRIYGTGDLAEEAQTLIRTAESMNLLKGPAPDPLEPVARG